MTASFTYSAQGGAAQYSDYVEWWCTVYGTRTNDIEPQEAEQFIEKYFASKGLKAANIRHKGRFIEADIYRNDKRLDVILFDRRTGRIRSTY
ncbi:MAG TPA: hypothetical protein VEI28_00715 [Thermodesulfovibrionales bacterium]|nr:hypothetical protein [Thermodesulfovibrionales bacterium]